MDTAEQTENQILNPVMSRINEKRWIHLSSVVAPSTLYNMTTIR